MTDNAKVRVLFVCMGNICRSPSAEGVFRKQVAAADLEFAVEIDSAGTHAYHIGEPPDPRSIEAAMRRGVDLSDQRARAVTVEDFNRFDYILAMDHDNFSRLQTIQPSPSTAQLSLFLEFDPGKQSKEVPDPYYGGGSGFEDVLDLLESASAAFIDRLRHD